MTLRLTHKGLILVLVPLIFELAFLLTMGTLVEHANQESEREIRSRTALSGIKTVGATIWRAGFLLERYAADGGLESRNACREAINSVGSRVRDVKTTLVSDIRQSKNLQDLVRDADQTMQLLHSGLAIIEDGKADWRLMSMTYTDRARELVGDIAQEIDAIMKVELEDSNRSRTAVIQARRNVFAGLTTGFAGNVLIAIALLLYFNRTTAKRLSVLLENTRKLSSGDPLPALLDGRDELSTIDASFHDMAEKLAASASLKQEFMTMISHELRTPLTSVQLFLNMLAQGNYVDVPDRVKVKASNQERNARRLIALINDLLDHEKLSRGKMDILRTTCSAAEIAEQSIENVKEFADRHSVFLEATVADQLVLADADRIVQVLVNLLSNAIKFSQAGDMVQLCITDEEDATLFEVSDQGRGISPEHIAKIFEKYHQVERLDATDKGGTGLGLPICKAIVEAHESVLEVESEMGAGSRFYFRLSKKVSAERNQVAVS